MKSPKRAVRSSLRSRTARRRPRVRKAQRIALFVDSENLEITVRQSYAGRRSSEARHGVFPDWRKIMPEVIGNREVVRTIYYKERGRPVSEKFRKFWEAEFQGEIRQPPKAADPYIIVDAIALSEKVDAIVIFSGDQDYLPLIPYLKARGCRVEIATFPQSAAREMKKAADVFHRLTKRHTIALVRTGRNVSASAKSVAPRSTTGTRRRTRKSAPKTARARGAS
ncbi:MAG: NYN domain-containing protein [Bdellovibrionota bacterium]